MGFLLKSDAKVPCDYATEIFVKPKKNQSQTKPP